MIYLHGVGHHHPSTVLDNAFFESLDIGTGEDWILSRVGIRERRTVLPLDYIRQTRNRDPRGAAEAALVSNAETGKRAAEMALARAGVGPGDVGMVIAGGCSPDRCIPAEACSIARALGIEAPAFDLHSACSTFGAHLHFADAMGERLPEFLLVVSPENTTRVVDFTDRASCILFGDATSAAVVSTRVPSRARIEFSSFGASPAGEAEVVVPRAGHFSQNGPVVQKFAIKKMSELLGDVQARWLAEPRRAGQAGRDYFVGHQANLTMLESVARRREVAEERHLHNIVHFGNQCAAGAPSVLSQSWDRFQDGDRAAVVVVGSGLSWSSLDLRFSG